MGKITHVIFADGERYPMLVDEMGIPDYWVTLFITARYRTSHTASSIENIIRNILHIKLWESINDRDLLSEFRADKFLSDEDVFNIRDHCYLRTCDVRAAMSKKATSSSKTNCFYPSVVRNLQTVSKEHYANRIASIAEYLHFIARLIVHRRLQNLTLIKQIDAMKALLNAQKNKVIRKYGASTDPDFQVPAPQIFDAFMDLIRVDNINNPFKNRAVRIRNKLMFEILYSTGCRSGELLSLQIDDIDFFDNRISIKRRHDVQYDPRTRQPVAKTLERTLQVSEALIQTLRSYIIEIRSGIPGANKHPILFVTHKPGVYSGRPLSDASFRNRILKPLILTNPTLFSEITRHGFRHNFNYRLSRRIDAHNRFVREDPEQAKIENKSLINEKQEIQIRKQLNGWVSDKSAEYYNRRHIKELADKFMMEDMLCQKESLGGKFK